MATLDRGDGITRFGFDLGAVFVDQPYDLVLRPELFGQYVADSGIGIYGGLPFAASIGDDDTSPPGDQDAFAIANIELGGLFVLDSPTLSWVFRLGVAGFTADSDLDGALTNAFASMARFTDFALAVPDAAYIRFAVSPLVHTGKLVLRFDVGFDAGFDDAGAAHELVRVNLAGGIDLDTVALSLESTNLFTPDDFGAGEQALHSLAFTVRFMGERYQPFLAAGAPLDDQLRDAKFFVSTGLQVVFR
jgi:hypothetical protein